MAIYTLHQTQQLPASIEKVWDFMSSPDNLKVITPQSMDFVVTSKNLAEKIYPGMLIEYTLRPVLGIKVGWTTEIGEVRQLEYFADDQKKGPYALWHHEHFFKTNEKGVLMKDVVHYAPPLGLLGAVANSLFIRTQLNGIFDYRRKKLEEIFGARTY